MAGFSLEFKRNYSPADTVQPHTIVPIGDVYANNIVDYTTTGRSNDATPRDNIEIIASQVPPRRISQNFLAPVDGVNNRRCQEWTMGYIQRLVDRNYLDESVIAIVQSQRDPPSFGIGLKAACRGGGGQAAAGPAYPAQQQAAASTAQQLAPAATQAAASAGQVEPEWVWHGKYQKYAYYDSTKWVWQQ